MKLVPPTKHELNFIRWRIWEPLRRNQIYRSEYKKLSDGFFLDAEARGIDALKQEGQLASGTAEIVAQFGLPVDLAGLEPERLAVDAFCDKFLIPYHIHPDTKFEDLTNPGWIFQDHYVPLFDHAAVVDVWDWIIDDHYLKVWIDLSAPINHIEIAVKKILDEWRSKWTDFYEMKINGAEKAVIIGDQIGKYLEVRIDMNAYRSTKNKSAPGFIESELGAILPSVLFQDAESCLSRFHPKKWHRYFQIFDLVQEKKIRPSILSASDNRARNLRLQYNRAKSEVEKFTEELKTKTIKKPKKEIEILDADLYLSYLRTLGDGCRQVKYPRPSHDKDKDTPFEDKDTTLLPDKGTDCPHCFHINSVFYAPLMKMKTCFECGKPVK